MAKKEVKKEESPVSDGLIAMVKDGDVIRCHPSQVANWERHGYLIRGEK